MADNRRIKNKIRGADGASFSFGMEDDLAAAYTQARLDELKAEGAIEGDWTSTKSGGDAQFEKRTAPGLNFVPLTISETLEAMRKLDFSERVTRSMTYHGDALKEAMKASVEPSKESEPSEADDFPEGFPAYGKKALQKLGKTAADVSGLTREQLIELDGIAERSADEIIAFFKKPDGENKEAK